MNHPLKKALLSSAVLASSTLALTIPEYAQAQDTAADSDVIIVTGSRGKPRALTDSPVPVDVISESEIFDVPFTDTNDILKTLVPSYSLSRQPISDGGTFIRPAQLRGLPTDKTLVLVNSKRRHRASLVQIGGSGTQGPDIATIPAMALKSVEVLRDGAASQYGSDAIAGVINFILRDNSEGGKISAEIGQFYEGDGLSTTFGANAGFGLGKNGFISISGEYSKSDATSRSEPYCESWACTDVNDPDFATGGSFDDTLAGYSLASYTAGLEDANIGFGDVVQPWGQPNSEAIRGFYNMGLDIGIGELYSFGNVSKSKADGSFFYRYPGNGTIEDYVLEDGSLWSPLSIFPGGFTPRFSGDVTDVSVLGGFKGEKDTGLTWDFSARFGENEIKYTLDNTINPSLGPDTPTSFRPGDLINSEIQFQADITKEFDAGLYSPALFAFGASYLDESYELVGNDEASYIAGIYATSDPYGFCTNSSTSVTLANGNVVDCSAGASVYRSSGVGSNGFPGYSPQFSGEYTRDSVAFYGDLSADVTENLFLQGALRYEDYSDFGNELVWKVAGQYDLTDNIGVRSSIGTGFRAPTPGQQGTTNVSTRLPNGFPVATGLFPATGPVAQALGAEPLKPETSTNFSAGVTGSFDKLNVTLDFYQIKLEDRVNAISTQDVSSDPTAGTAYDNFLALQSAGVAGAESIGGVFYFTNAFDTKTTGADLVVTYPIEWGNGSSTRLTGSLNYNKTEFDGNVDDLFNAESQFDFENGTPELRAVLTGVHDIGNFSVLGRANYYGSYENSNGGSTISVTQEFDPEIMFDLEGSYTISDKYKLSVGARNVFDAYPAPGEIGETCCGRIYRSDSIVDWQGGYYYSKFTADF